MKSILSIPKKWIGLLATGGIAVVVVVAGVLMLNKEDSYRQIQVYQTEGIATVEREGDTLDAYQNMQLISEDILETAVESYVHLQLDNDKYILMEPDTKIHLQATGNSVDSKTKIYLDKGAIVNQIENPLSKNSEYQVTTPNATMAVRGTKFRVEVTYDENGVCYTVISVYDGSVECRLIFPDGTIDKESVIIEVGKEVWIWGDDTDSDYMRTENAEYEGLLQKVLEFLGIELDDEETKVEDPTPEATPTEEPIPEVTPTEEPTPEVTPTEEPTPEVTPTEEPTPEVTPTEEPTPEVIPTKEPEPTVRPTVVPTAEPTVRPTVVPTVEPTVVPTAEPTAKPTVTPTATPTTEATVIPTEEPTPTPQVTTETKVIQVTFVTSEGSEFITQSANTTVTTTTNIVTGESTVAYSDIVITRPDKSPTAQGYWTGSWTGSGSADIFAEGDTLTLAVTGLEGITFTWVSTEPEVTKETKAIAIIFMSHDETEFKTQSVNTTVTTTKDVVTLNTTVDYSDIEIISPIEGPTASGYWKLDEDTDAFAGETSLTLTVTSLDAITFTWVSTAPEVTTSTADVTVTFVTADNVVFAQTSSLVTVTTTKDVVTGTVTTEYSDITVVKPTIQPQIAGVWSLDGSNDAFATANPRSVSITDLNDIVFQWVTN